MSQLSVQPFFDDASNTFSYVAHDPTCRAAAIIDPVLDYDQASARTATDGAARIAEFVRQRQLSVEWILETHAHADHISAAVWLQRELGGQIAIGAGIVEVQQTFARMFNIEHNCACDGSQFSQLFGDGDRFALGELEVQAWHTPGHTPGCVSYLIGDTVFVGDTLFMPDYGTARCDFPGGDAATLFRSIKRLYTLPTETRMFVCHDYLPKGRTEYRHQTSVGQQRSDNIHLNDATTEQSFVKMRTERDAGLAVPTLLLPSIQINIRGGQLPDPEDNDTSYLKIPLNTI